LKQHYHTGGVCNNQWGHMGRGLPVGTVSSSDLCGAWHTAHSFLSVLQWTQAGSW